MKRQILVVAGILAWFSFSYAANEEGKLTITTYYPSPYGSYRELSAVKMKIGVNYSNGKTSVNDNNLIVEGNVGIGTTSPSFNAPNGLATGNLDANDIYLRGPNKWLSQSSGWVPVPSISKIWPGSQGNSRSILPGVSPTTHCKANNYSNFSGACRAKSGNFEIEGTLLANTFTGKWLWSCQYGPSDFAYMDNKSEILCVN